MAAIRLKIERLQDRVHKHETRHAEMMSRSQELPPPLSAEAKETMVSGVRRAGDVTKEKTTQLGEGVKGAGAKAGGAIARTPGEQETYTTYERTEETRYPTPPPPEPEGEGGGKIAEDMSSHFSQGTQRKGEEPKIKKLERQTEEP